MRRALLVPALLGTLLLAAAPAHAAPPSNDDAAGAVAIGLGPGAGATGNTLEATSSTEPGTAAAPAACARMGKTVWFKVRGTGHAITVRTTGSTIDTVVSVYDSGNNPSDGNRVKCDDDGAGIQSAAVVPATVRGNTYLIQVGGKIEPACGLPADNCAPFGAVKVTAEGTPRPGNDDRANAQTLLTGTPASVDNTGATSEAGELLSCGAAAYAATVWFAWTAPAVGTPTITTSAAFTGTLLRPSDTVMTVFRASDGAVVACNDDGDASGAAKVTLPGPVATGDQLLVQVGARGADGPGLGEGPITTTVTLAPLDADGDGFPPPADCDDTNAAINPGATDIPDDALDQDCKDGPAVDLDRDRDGFPRPADCDDANAAIHPGAVDVPRDGVDQDCRDGDADFAVPAISFFARFKPAASGRMRVTVLQVKTLSKGDRVKVSCTGKGCRPIKRARVNVRRRRDVLDVTKRVQRLRLAPGARLTVEAGQDGQAHKVFRLQAQRRTFDPTTLCRRPGEKPVRCWTP